MGDRSGSSPDNRTTKTHAKGAYKLLHCVCLVLCENSHYRHFIISYPFCRDGIYYSLSYSFLIFGSDIAKNFATHYTKTSGL